MLKTKSVPIDTGRECVAYLNRQCAVYPAEEFPALTRIEIVGDTGRVTALLHLVDDAALVDADEIGLSRAAFETLGAREGARVTLEHQSRPASQDALRRKIAGAELTDEDTEGLLADMAAGRYREEEVAAYLVTAAQSLSDGEVLGVARARARHGQQIHWESPIVVDKHSMGGIPGNRVTMIVVPIVAAHGLTIPKTSSRAITSPAGTADCMEVLARVDLGPDAVRDVVAHANGCIAWNGRLNHSPLDDVMNRITRPLGLDSRKWSVASILSKKLAAGSTHVVIDLPAGPGAKLSTEDDARALGDLFVAIGRGLGMTIEAHVTDGTCPIGNGVGPALEARDVMAVLRGEDGAPADLRQKALTFAGRILAFDPAISADSGLARARDLLASGAALAAMEKIIERQGEPPHPVTLGSMIHEVAAPKDGTVAAIDCYQIAGIARRAGAPLDKGAGLDLLKKVGGGVRAGEPLYRIHAHIDGDFRAAVDMANEADGYDIA